MVTNATCAATGSSYIRQLPPLANRVPGGQEARARNVVARRWQDRLVAHFERGPRREIYARKNGFPNGQQGSCADIM
jgi:hypothetical protein